MIDIAISLNMVILIAQLISIFFGAMLALVIRNRKIRKNLTFYLMIFNLIINSFLLSFSFVYNLVDIYLNLSLSTGTHILIEIIFIVGLILSIFSKKEFQKFDLDNLSDSLLLMVILGLIGMIISFNMLSIITCFLLILICIGIIFYISDYKKEFKVLKLYFVSSFISILILSLATLIIFLETNSLSLNIIKFHNFSEIMNISISFMLILGIGIPCGLFPLSVFHLKNYFQDCSYTQLLLYSLFNYITAFLSLRILNIFTFSLSFNSFMLLILSGIGLIITFFFIITELFTSFDGSTYSIKKIYGYSVISDFNIFILICTLLPLISTNKAILFNMILYYQLNVVSFKLLLFYNFYPLMLETYDDNIKILGDFWKKHKSFSFILFLTGLIFVFPLGFISFFSMLNYFSLDEILINSLLNTLANMIFVLFSVYIVITLILLSTLFIQISFNKKVQHEIRENVEVIAKKDYWPFYVLMTTFVLYIILYLIGNTVFFDMFKKFLLIAN